MSNIPGQIKIIREFEVVVQDYITTNFPGYLVDDADMTTACDGTALLEVELKDAQGAKLEVAFDVTGNQVYTATEMKKSGITLRG